MLDKRLQMCADMVRGTGIVCDVGTDHAYLAAELIVSGKCEKVIASDVKQGPLDAAAKTVEKYGIADKVELVLSDGLENVCLDGVSDIVIAGMGGETIAEIIRRIDIPDNIRLILQPMTKSEILRSVLCSLGYIVTEKAVEDGNRLYTVMCAEIDHDEYPNKLTEYESLRGFFADDDELGKKYRRKEAERLKRAAGELEKAGMKNEAVHFSALSRQLTESVREESIYDIYDFLDGKFPFCTQEKWDNSGLLVENAGMHTSKVMLALDITNDVVMEAAAKDVRLIISHHPVIFDPLKKIERHNPVRRMISCHIAAICLHTNLDIAAEGTNGVIVDEFAKRCRIKDVREPLEELGNGMSLGCIVELETVLEEREFAKILKDIFGCMYVKANRCISKPISRVAICSGSGGSLLGIAAEKNCDALVTGDVKHDVWIDANNRKFKIFDCGHYHTEVLVLGQLRRILEEKFPLLDIEIAESSYNPCVYLR